MRNFFDAQGRTRIFAESYDMYVAGEKSAENEAHGRKSHLAHNVTT